MGGHPGGERADRGRGAHGPARRLGRGRPPRLVRRDHSAPQLRERNPGYLVRGGAGQRAHRQRPERSRHAGDRDDLQLRRRRTVGPRLATLVLRPGCSSGSGLRLRHHCPARARARARVLRRHRPHLRGLGDRRQPGDLRSHARAAGGGMVRPDPGGGAALGGDHRPEAGVGRTVRLRARRRHRPGLYPRSLSGRLERQPLGHEPLPRPADGAVLHRPQSRPRPAAARPGRHGMAARRRPR